MEREVIVVGAGPSGAAAAALLAQRGHDVLLLDRQEFPRDKACGDGIPAGAIDILYSMGMEERIREAGFYPAHRLLLSSPNGHVLEADLQPSATGAHAHVVTRLQFDALVQAHAVDSGAEFCRAQVTEPILEEGRVAGVRARLNGKVEEIRSRLVVGADGVTSMIGRALRPDKHEDRHRAVALRAYIEDIEEKPHEVEFYLYRDILPGYAWIFPLGEGRANLGLGMRLDRFRESRRSLEEMVQVFLEMPAIAKRLKRGGELRDVAVWQLNFGSQDMQRAYEGAMLIGDAAGLINPLTGGGIHNGLVSAREAAAVAHEALRENDLSRGRLQEYERRTDAELRRGMRKSYLIQRLLLRFPSAVEQLIRWGGSNNQVAQVFVSKL